LKVDDSLPIDSLKCIAWKGRAVVVGFAGGKIEKVLAPQKELGFILTDSQLPLNLVLLKNIEITGIHWGAYMSVYPLSFNNGGI
jgi:NADPH2:quinone reductase